MMETELAVVGAGPAGLSAAVVAAEAGVKVTVLDEQERAGGQIFRRPPESFRVTDRLSDSLYTEGRRLLEQAARQPNIRFEHASTVWGIFTDDANLMEEKPPRSLAVTGPQGTYFLKAKIILLAPGAYDLPVPFPGWDLPGVMTAGGVQALLKSDRVLAGERFVLAGGHPLLLVLAEQILGAGGTIAAVAIAQRPATSSAVRHLPALLGRLAALRRAARALAALRKARVPVFFGHGIRRAEGTSRVERCAIGPVDEAWRPTAGTERYFEADAVAIGYGFVPSTELPRQAGCRLIWDRKRGGWICEVDERMESSVPGIFAAGEITGVAGAEAAMAEGFIAGAAVAEELGFLSPDASYSLMQEYRRRFRRHRRFAAAVTDIFAPGPGLFEWMTPETTVCRCEELRVQEIQDLLAAHQHLSGINEVKLISRCGMGPCQGRMCHMALTELIARLRGIPPEQIGPMRAQPPTKPIPIGQILEGDFPSAE